MKCHSTSENKAERICPEKILPARMCFFVTSFCDLCELSVLSAACLFFTIETKCFCYLWELSPLSNCEHLMIACIVFAQCKQQILPRDRIFVCSWFMFQHLLRCFFSHCVKTVESCTDMIPRDSNNGQRFCLPLTFHTFPFVHAICTTYRRRSHYMFLTRLSYLEVVGMIVLLQTGRPPSH